MKLACWSKYRFLYFAPQNTVIQTDDQAIFSSIGLHKSKFFKTLVQTAIQRHANATEYIISAVDFIRQTGNYFSLLKEQQTKNIA